MKILEIFPGTNTVQQVSQYFVDLGGSGRWCYYTVEAFLFFSLLFLAIHACLRLSVLPSRMKLFEKIILSDLTFCFFIVAFVLMARIPLAIMGIQNPDEALWVIDAKTLLHDPRIFVSVDTSTGGPLVPMALLILKIFGLPIDQGSLKIMSGAIMAFGASFLFLAGSRIMTSSLARLTVLPLVVLVSFMKDNDMISYNSEHPVIFLLCLSLFFLARLCTSGPVNYKVNLFLLGFSLGFVPFAKLQGAPIALFIGLVGCYVLITRGMMKRLALLILGALSPAIIFFIALWSYDGLKYYWISHILQNLIYADQIPIDGNVFNYKMNLLFRILSIPKELSFFLYYSLTAIVSLSFLILCIPGKLVPAHRSAIIFSILFALSSVYIIVAPNRDYAHYGLFSILPLTILPATLLSCVRGKVKNLTDGTGFFSSPILTSFLPVLVLLCTSFYYFMVNFTYRPYYLDYAIERYQGYAPQGSAGAVLNYYYVPKTKLAVWGYEPQLFEGTDFLLGTRYGVAVFAMVAESLREYYYSTYLADMKKNRPKLFVYPYARSEYSFKDDNFEDHAEIKKYVNENYTMSGEIDGYRIYVRNDKLSEKRPWFIDRPNIVNSTDQFHSQLQQLVKAGSFLQFGGWAVLTENVIDQRVALAIFSKNDTIYVDTYQASNKVVADFSGKKSYMMCGFLGFLPLKEIPEGNLSLGVLVESEGKVGLRRLDTTLNRDSLQSKP